MAGLTKGSASLKKSSRMGRHRLRVARMKGFGVKGGGSAGTPMDSRYSTTWALLVPHASCKAVGVQ